MCYYEQTLKKGGHMSVPTTHPPKELTPSIAYQMLQRMRSDYRDGDIFEKYCEDDPSLAARYEMLQNAIKGTRYEVFSDIFASNDTFAEQQNAFEEQVYEEDIQRTDSLSAIPLSQEPLYRSTSSKGAIWNYRSDVLSLYILQQLLDEQSTPLLQQDIAQVKQDVESFGNRNLKQKKHSAEEILKKEQKRALVGFGTLVANALFLFKKDPYASQRAMDELVHEIEDTTNIHNAKNMWRIRKVAKNNYFVLRKRHER